MRAGEALAAAEVALGGSGVETPRLDAELILGQVLGATRSALATARGRDLSPREQARFDALLARRAAREPLAYVLGGWGFRTLELRIDARALVPRPETEIVVERALALVAALPAPRVCDVGTGSGAIALAIAREHPGARVTATDLSPEALALAAENAAALALALELRCTSLLEGIEGPFDLVVSNPPYVLATELPALEPEVRDWEPRLALEERAQTAGLAAAARRVLAPGGFLVLECHAERARQLARSLRGLGYRQARVTRDLAGRERVVEARWQPAPPA